MPPYRYIPVMKRELVSEFFEELERNSSSFVNGRVLLCLMKLAYYCGLKKRELIGLRIKNVQRPSGEILDEIKLKDGNVALGNDIKNFLQEHIEYLRTSGYQVLRNSPLFPRKLAKRPPRGSGRANGHKYRGRTLQRDLRKFRRRVPSWNILDTLRWAGIFHYYDSLKSKANSSDCVCETARFARFDRKYFERIIKYKWYRYNLP